MPILARLFWLFLMAPLWTLVATIATGAGVARWFEDHQR